MKKIVSLVNIILLLLNSVAFAQVSKHDQEAEFRQKTLATYKIYHRSKTLPEFVLKAKFLPTTEKALMKFIWQQGLYDKPALAVTFKQDENRAVYKFSNDMLIEIKLENNKPTLWVNNWAVHANPDDSPEVLLNKIQKIMQKKQSRVHLIELLFPEAQAHPAIQGMLVALTAMAFFVFCVKDGERRKDERTTENNKILNERDRVEKQVKSDAADVEFIDTINDNLRIATFKCTEAPENKTKLLTEFKTDSGEIYNFTYTKSNKLVKMVRSKVGTNKHTLSFQILQNGHMNIIKTAKDFNEQRARFVANAVDSSVKYVRASSSIESLQVICKDEQKFAEKLYSPRESARLEIIKKNFEKNSVEEPAQRPYLPTNPKHESSSAK